jgi:hypothetical protein
MTLAPIWALLIPSKLCPKLNYMKATPKCQIPAVLVTLTSSEAEPINSLSSPRSLTGIFAFKSVPFHALFMVPDELVNRIGSAVKRGIKWEFNFIASPLPFSNHFPSLGCGSY